MREPAAICAVIFDCDGVLVDTEAPVYEFWSGICEEHGCALPLVTWVACVGGSSADFDPYRYLEEHSQRPVDREQVRAREREMDEHLMGSVPLLPGVLDYLAQARQMGARVAVASNSSPRWVRGILRQTGIVDHFDAVIARTPTMQPKPHPDLYQRALGALRLGPHEAIAIEDSPNGVRAAQAAGIWCVAVPNAITSGLPLDHADLRLASLPELPLPALIARALATRRDA